MTAPFDVDKLPGLKRADIQPCLLCGKGVAACGSPCFYRVRLARFILDGRAIQRRHGLEEMLGGGTAGAALAEIMGDGADLAKQVGDEDVGLVCDDCAVRRSLPVAGIGERFSDRAEAQRAREEAAAAAK